MALRTGDPAEAEVRFATIFLYLAGVWQSVRDGPLRLPQKPAVALAGEIYREFVEAIEGDPGQPDAGAD